MATEVETDWAGRTRKPAPKQRISDKTAYKYSVIWAEARDAGLAAGEAHTPTPMIVGSPRVPFFDERIDPTKKVWRVDGGVCGFGWVHIPNGRCGFARWALETSGRSGFPLGHKAWEFGRYKGVDIHCGPEFGQSMERQERWARAAAEVLRRHGIEAQARSRMD